MDFKQGSESVEAVPSPELFKKRLADMSWFERYEFIEAQMKADPGLSEAQIAEKLGLSPFVVNQAMKLSALLSRESKEKLRESLRAKGLEGGKA